METYPASRQSSRVPVKLAAALKRVLHIRGFNSFRVGPRLSQPRVGARSSRQPWAELFNAFGVVQSVAPSIEVQNTL
jgi:hypothetical protein